jgi:hypothetical protein
MRRLLALLTIAAALPAHALDVNLIETPTTAAAAATTLTNAVLAPISNITVLNSTFVGAIGTGTTSQSATYTGFSLVPSSGSTPTLTLPDGIFLTSGTANIPFSNTESAFSPFAPGTGGDAQVSALLTAASAPSSVVNDVNSLTIEFTVAAGITSISSQFVFGSDEFPDQSVTDFFMFIVDGVNYAKFADGTLVSFVEGLNAANFLDNNNGAPGPYAIEYDGLSLALGIVGLLDTSLSTHTLKIVTGDTSDDIFDSGVFIGGLTGGTSTGGGGICGGANQPPCDTGGGDVPEPGTIALAGLGLSLLAARRKLAAKRA